MSLGPRVAIVGGGAIGSACALFVRQALPSARVTVFERDPSYARASSALSACSIRQQFSAPVNISLSLFGLDFIRSQAVVRDAVGFQETGYLFLAGTEEGAGVLQRNAARANALGADLALLPPSALAARFPWLRSDDLRLGCFGATGEGYFDGFGFLQSLRRLAQAQGALYVNSEVVAMATTEAASATAGRVASVATADGASHDVDWVVNAGGPYAAAVAAQVGIALPVHARRRTVFVVTTESPIPHCPLVVDPAGFWFRGDGCGPPNAVSGGAPFPLPAVGSSQFLAGFAPPEADDPSDLPLEPEHAYFEETLWPQLAHRVPLFEACRVRSAWAGYYEVHPMDHNAIVGPHPSRLPNLLFANGFSGHGLQHAVGIGRGIAEWITHGRYKTIDLSELGFARVVEGKPFLEENVI